MIDFLFLYEYINREVENLALLKYELSKRGYKCRISHFNGSAYWYHSIFSKAKVVVVPWLRENMNVAHYLPLAKKPYKLVDMQWEQIYTSKYIQDGYCTIKHESLKAYHLCWGANSYRRLIEWGSNENKLFRTGAIQLDFGQDLFSEYYKHKYELAEEFNLDPSKKWIIFISSFAYANYGEEAIRKIEEEFNCSLQYEIDLNQKSQKILLNWIESFLKSDDCEFIYRPHPSENLSEVLIEMSQNQRCFHIINSYSVKQWIKRCDIINIWISTSIAECYAMGKICNIVRPLPIIEDLEVENLKGKTFVETKEQFIVANQQNNCGIVQNSEKLMKEFVDYYDFDSKTYSFIKTADILEDIYKNNDSVKYNFTLKEKLRFSKRKYKDILVSFLIDLEMKTGLVKFLILPSIIKRNIIKDAKKNNDALKVEKQVASYLSSREEV